MPVTLAKFMRLQCYSGLTHALLCFIFSVDIARVREFNFLVIVVYCWLLVFFCLFVCNY